MKNLLLPALLLSLSVCLQAQYEYNPSDEHPFGQPHPEAPDEIMDYHPMIGICDCNSTSRNPDGTWADTITMIWEWRYIMNGWGVQDLTLKEDGVNSGSIRQFNADSSQWYVHYFSSNSPTPRLSSWAGGMVGDDIILYKDQTAPNGMEGKYKITFHNISDEGFHWKGEWVNPTETIIYPTWYIECVKQKRDKG
ncbi:MAG: hypothetical protein HKN09_13190 [Saprospiraceae bacterium]|nr:hypothetical protein [Saprospiraceae bacterium]